METNKKIRKKLRIFFVETGRYTEYVLNFSFRILIKFVLFKSQLSSYLKDVVRLDFILGTYLIRQRIPCVFEKNSIFSDIFRENAPLGVKMTEISAKLELPVDVPVLSQNE